MARKKPSGRRKLADQDRKSKKITATATKAQYAQWLINAAKAGMTPPDFVRERVCSVSDELVYPAPKFEKIDSVIRLSTAVIQLRRALVDTGDVPDHALDQAIEKLESLIEELVE